MVSRTAEKAIYEKSQGCCAICGRETAFDEGEVDHIKPKTKGGTDEPSNLQWLCHRCNKLKGSTRTNEEVRELLDVEVVTYIIPRINYELMDLKKEFIIRGALEKTFDNILSEPQEMLVTLTHLLKRMGIEPTPETVISLIAGNIMGATMVSVSGSPEKEPNEKEIERIVEKMPAIVGLLKKRIPEMRAIFQNALPR